MCAFVCTFYLPIHVHIDVLIYAFKLYLLYTTVHTIQLPRFETGILSVLLSSPHL